MGCIYCNNALIWQSDHLSGYIYKCKKCDKIFFTDHKGKLYEGYPC